MPDVWPDTPLVNDDGWPDAPLIRPDKWPDAPLIAPPGGVLGYPGQIGRAMVRGVAGAAGTALKGVGAMQAASEPILGQSLDESVAGALLQGRLPNVVQAPGTGTRRSAADTGPYQAGEALEQGAADRFPSSRELHPFVEDVAGAVGQVGANIGLAAIPAVGLPISVAGMLSQGAGEAAERAVKAGATPEQEGLASSLGVFPGATEFVDLMLPKLGGVGQALSLLKRIGVKAFLGLMTEGAQEGAQEFIQNAIEKGVYNPKKELGENVLYSAAVGGVAGGLAGGAMPGRREVKLPENVEFPGQEQVQQPQQLLLEKPAIPMPAPPPPTEPPPRPPLLALPPPSPVPQPRPETVRLYRGEGTEEGRAAFAGSGMTGGWFTTDPEKAKLYGNVSYVDVTREELGHFAQGHGGPDEFVTDNPAFRARVQPLEGGVDVSAAARVKTSAPSAVEAAIEMGAPPPVEPTAPVPPPTQPEPGLLHQGAFTRKEVEIALARNLQRLMNYNIALADPETQRFPDQIQRLQEQIPILRQQITEQYRFLGIHGPLRKVPKIVESPSDITPQEVAAGLDPPPRNMTPLPVVVDVPEEVNIAAAQIEILPPPPRSHIPLEVALERPLNLDDEQVQVAAGNWGLMRYALRDGEKTYFTSAFNISPGQKPTGTRIRVPQDNVSPNNVIIHSNAAVNPTGGPLVPGGPRVDMVEAGVAKFGQRFWDYEYLMGEQFIALRNAISTIPLPASAQRGKGVPTDFSGLLSVAVGITHDPGAYGWNIRVPVQAIFVNVGASRYIDSQAAATSMMGTMLHESAHHVHRTEARIEDVMAEMIVSLRQHPNFDYNGFKQNLANIVEAHHDVMMWMKGLYADGNVQPIGSPLPPGKGRSRRKPRDLGSTPDPEGSGWGSTLSDWASVGAKDTGGVTDGRSGGATFARVGGRGGSSDYGRAANRRALEREVGHKDVHPYTQTEELEDLAQAINTVHGGTTPPGVAAMRAHADHINWIYKYFGSLLDLTQRNLRFDPLVKYTELARLWHTLEAMVQDAATTIAKRWRGLGEVQSDALTNMFHDLVNMTYLTPAERAAGVVRQPTIVERDAIAARYNVSLKAKGVYNDVTRFFRTFLRLTAQNAKAAAQRTITDPVALSDALNAVDSWVVTLEKRPYFPFLRFGTHYVHVKDAQGRTLWFSLHEKEGLRSAYKNQQRELAKQRAQHPNAQIDSGVMPEDVRPFYGMPPTLLKTMAQKLTLTQAQMDALEQLQFMMSPEASFKRRFAHKGYIPGYSRNFIRAFSHYAFHGARYYAKTKYIWEMEDQIAAARKVGGDKATRIANFMDDHLYNTVMNIKGDHGLLKGIAFNWHLAFMPSSAFVNITQTPLVTGPFLGSKFGDARAVKALSNAFRQLNTYYRKGSLAGMTEFDMRALSVGIKWGVVSETQASELASLGNGNGLLMGVGGNQAQQAMHWFQEKGALMFELAEQFNRRVAFRAALELARNDPNSRYVREAVMKNPTMYNDLINGVNTGNQRFSPQEAEAIVTAIDTLEQTQFVYARWARPRFMRGRWAGAITVFMRYTQGVLFLLLNENRSYRLRYLLTAAALGGLAGLMGYDEVKELFEAILKQLGFNANVDREIRKYITQFTGSPEAADYVLHGWARRGFNVAHILDALGSFATGRPGRGLLDPPHLGAVNVGAPVLDMSSSISPKLLPVQVGKLLSPFQDPREVVSEQGARASGAVFSVAFNMYKALMGSKEEFSDTKRWEKAVPRAAAGISKTFRAFTEERERFGGTAPSSARTLVKYDMRDTEQIAEVIFRGMGFRPLRESTEWDFHHAKLEHRQFIEGTRKLLLEQLFETIKDKDDKGKQSVIGDIRKFNERVRGTDDRAYAITGEGIQRSMQQRARELALSEAGLSGKKREIPVIRGLRELYPRAVEIQRR